MACRRKKKCNTIPMTRAMVAATANPINAITTISMIMARISLGIFIPP